MSEAELLPDMTFMAPERYASGAAGSGSGADAGRHRLHAFETQELPGTLPKQRPIEGLPHAVRVDSHRLG